MKRMTRTLIFCSLLAVAQGAPGSARAASQGVDLNGDGTSDTVLVDIGTDGSLGWKGYSGVDASLLSQLPSFGKVGDNLIVANWLSRSTASFGTISPRSDGHVSWTITPPTGLPISRVFGSKNDLFVSGGDFNGDGVADAALVRSSGSSLVWTIRENFFGQVAGAAYKVTVRVRGQNVVKPIRALIARTRKIKFGKSGDTPFYVRVRGTNDWLALFRPGPKGGKVYFLNPLSGKQRSVSIGADVSGSQRPLPLGQTSGSDLIAFVMRGASTTHVVVKRVNGSVVAATDLPGTGEIVVGDFLAGFGDEVAVQTAHGVVAWNPLTGAKQSIAYPAGILVDANNITSFSAPSGGGSGSGGGTSGGTGGGTGSGGSTGTGHGASGSAPNTPPAAGALGATCLHLHTMFDKSVLYKPGSGGTNDARTAKPLFLWYDGYTFDPGSESLTILASDGSVIGSFGRYPSDRPLVRYYSAFAGGTGLSGTELRNAAAAKAGSGTIYLLAPGGHCWGPVADPNQRTGGK